MPFDNINNGDFFAQALKHNFVTEKYINLHS